MKKIPISTVKGKEILAKPIWNNDGVMLIPEGTIMKVEYVSVLEDLGIKYISIEENLYDGVEYDEILKEETKENCQAMIHTILSTKLQSESEEDIEIAKVAESIIDDIMSQEDIVISITEIRKKDDYAYEHSVSVSALSVLLALKLNIDPAIVKEYAKGALLHDIGMTFLPDHYYEEGEGTSQKEFDVIKKHVQYGYDNMVKRGFLSDEALDIIKNHHERIDGSGYPDGLKGNQIDQGSRIVAVCDTFDAMVYSTPNKNKVYEAVEYIQANQGRLFDSKVSVLFLESVALYPTGSRVLTNTGEEAIVYKQNKGFPSRPVLRIIDEISGNDDGNNIILKDLMKELSMFIEDIL